MLYVGNYILVLGKSSNVKKNNNKYIMNKDVFGLINRRLFSIKYTNVIDEMGLYVPRVSKYSHWAELLGFNKRTRHWNRQILHPVMSRDMLIAQDVHFTWLSPSLVFSRKRCAFSIINGVIYVLISKDNQTNYRLYSFSSHRMCWNYLFENILNQT